MMATLSWSTSLRDLLSAVAGLPSSSSTTTPILIGADCAGAPRGAASDVTKASTTAEATKRTRVIGGSPSELAVRSSERAEHATRREQDDADVHGAENEQPPLGVHADEVLQEHDHRSAEGRSCQGAGAAQRHHQERFYGGHQLHVHRADEAVVPGPQHARESREAARDHEREILVQPHVITERPHARLAFANALQREPERRARERAERAPRQRRGHEHE